mmetsp:Transcript_39054/g.94457  ORF Transcript_39054/g.94457 Transcript_39054/m.94457 type:complete len:125 (+) Transcript_39054:190-564(+)
MCIAATPLPPPSRGRLCGMSLPKRASEFRRMVQNQSIRAYWKSLDVLLLDECAMVNADFYDFVPQVHFLSMLTSSSTSSVAVRKNCSNQYSTTSSYSQSGSEQGESPCSIGIITHSSPDTFRTL